MATCNHKNLVLLGKTDAKVRCRTCSLVISARELDGGFCPECHEVSGRRRYDFEAVKEQADDVTRYRCEGCGALIEWRG